MAPEQHDPLPSPEPSPQAVSPVPIGEPGGTPPTGGPASPRTGLSRTGAIVLFFLALALLIGGLNNVSVGRDWQVRHSPSQAVSGDEPHYLLVISSLLFDQDLQLRDDYVRVARGSPEAGMRFRGVALDHHTLVSDPSSRQTRYWHDVFDTGAPVLSEGRPVGFHQRDSRFPAGPDYEETSSHPVAFPALVALLLAPFSPTPDHLERDVNRLQQLFCWLGALAVYFIGRRAGFSRRQAVAAAALLVLASPWLAYSRSFFSEPAIALMLTLGLWALQCGRPVAASMAVSLAMAMKPPFVLVGAAWLLSRLWARRWGEALRLAGGMLGGGVLLLAFNQWQSHVWLVSGAFGWVWARGLSGLHSTLLHPAYGLLMFVPWVPLALGGLLEGRGRDGGRPSLSHDMALPLLAYLGVLSASAFTGGTCYGPRYWIAVMPWLALAAVECMRHWGRKGWLGLGLAALAALWLSGPGALRYAELWDVPAARGWTAR